MAPPRPVRAELGALMRLALPLAVASAGQAAMGVVDAAVCGRAGAVVLAGAGLGNVLFLDLAVTGMGLMMGLDPLVAQAFGAGDARGARRLLWQGTWLALGAGVLLALPWALVPLALRPLGIEDAVAREAGRFIWIRLPSLPALLFFVVAKSYLQGLGLTRAVLVSTLLANVVNFGLDLLLVFGGGDLPGWAGPLRAIPPLGAAGSGLATGLVTVVQALYLALAVRAVRVEGGLAGQRRPERAAIVRAARVGAPIALHLAAEVSLFALVGFLAGRLGRAPLAAHQIAIALASTSFTFAVGIGTAGGVRVGWAVGAGDTAAARRAGLTAFAAGAAVMALSGLVFFLFPGPLARLMTSDPSVAPVAAALLSVAAVFQLSDGVQAVGAGVLRGAGDTRYTFGANMVGHWLIGLPIAIGLGLAAGLGVTGLWWGLCGGLSVVAAALLHRFLRLSSRPIAALAPAGAGARPEATS
ncbi:MATE family efflux transporter [Anaeromyxobacter diazotrophicus]|nr:MATE family efflux transporter [Anaeromyxobacter diazotrophicus]